MKKVITYLLLIGIISVTFGVCFPVSAAQTDDWTYYEDFEYGDTDIVAYPDCGSSKIIKESNGNHALHIDSNDVGYSLTCFGPYCADFDFTFRIKQVSHGGDFGWSKVMFHSKWGEHSTYRLNLYNYRVSADFGDETEKISKSLGENNKFKFEDDVWHTVSIYARGTKYTVTVDGEKAMTFLSDYNDEGCFGFCGWQAEYDVDDIRILEYVDGEAPELVDEESKKENGIIETEKKTRTMKDEFIKSVSTVVESSGKTVAIVAFAVAAVALCGIITIFVVAFVKKKKK